MKERVLVGLSGGIDSSVTALILKDIGFDVVGAIVEIWESPPQGEGEAKPWFERACCHVPMVEYLCQEVLGIPVITIPKIEAFRDTVVAPFRDGYRTGITPNPCTICNAEIKIRTLREKADELGIRYVATGHYARMGYSRTGRFWGVQEGRDARKDQSYFLSRVSRDVLRGLLFPLGEWTKDEVRTFGRIRGLPVDEMVENQEACFLSERNVVRFLEKDANAGSAEAGDQWSVLTDQGDALGRISTGIGLTRGQRKGLGIAAGQKLYVRNIDVAKREVVMAPKDRLLEKKFSVIEAIGPLFEQESNQPVRVRFRSTMAPIPCAPIRGASRHAERRFALDGMSDGITPGQVAVFYDEDGIVLGSGILLGGEKRTI